MAAQSRIKEKKVSARDGRSKRLVRAEKRRSQICVEEFQLEGRRELEIHSTF